MPSDPVCTCDLERVVMVDPYELHQLRKRVDAMETRLNYAIVALTVIVSFLIFGMALGFI